MKKIILISSVACLTIFATVFMACKKNSSQLTPNPNSKKNILRTGNFEMPKVENGILKFEKMEDFSNYLNNLKDTYSPEIDIDEYLSSAESELIGFISYRHDLEYLKSEVGIIPGVNDPKEVTHDRYLQSVLNSKRNIIIENTLLNFNNDYKIIGTTNITTENILKFGEVQVTEGINYNEFLNSNFSGKEVYIGSFNNVASLDYFSPKHGSHTRGGYRIDFHNEIKADDPCDWKTVGGGPFTLIDEDKFSPNDVVSNATWTINWGDESIETQMFPIFGFINHTYASAGNYIISISATDGSKTGTSAFSISIQPVPNCNNADRNTGYIWSYNGITGNGALALRHCLDIKGEDLGFMAGYDRMEATAESYRWTGGTNGSFKHRDAEQLHADVTAGAGCVVFNDGGTRSNRKTLIVGSRNIQQGSTNNGDLHWTSSIANFSLTKNGSTISHSLTLNSCP